MTSTATIRSTLLRYPQQLLHLIPASLHAHAPVLVVVLIYWISGIVIGHIGHMPPAATISTYLPSYMIMMPFMVLFLLVGRAGIIMIVDRPARPLTQFLREFRTTLATPERLARALPILVAMLVFGGTFTVVKASIPSFAAYTWDPAFEQFDRWMHGGVAPWEWLQPLLGHPFITHVINIAYSLWFYFLNLIWVWQAFRTRDDALRLRFFLSLTVGWILLGSLGAMLFASAGPCYYGRIVGGPDPFAPLMTYLHHADELHSIWALGAQQMLWDNYNARDLVLGSGISAMPSMHVAIATLLALVCWRANRKVGIAMTLFAFVIMIGSVHLGWHYAVDGYAGAAGMLVIWWGAGRFVNWWSARRSRQEPGIPVSA